jgi:Tuberculosis necrotizing toxin
MNRMLAGEAGVMERLTIALHHPRDAAVGAAKGVANDTISIANVLARGQAMRTAGELEQSAALQSLFGMNTAATQMRQSANIMRDVGKTDTIPTIPYKNTAQEGGATIATITELASGAKAVYSVGKAAIKHAPDLLKAAKGQLDELSSKGMNGAKAGGKGTAAIDDTLKTAKNALGDLPLNSKLLDDLYQGGKLSMDEARALAKNAGWKDDLGGWIYPPNNGFNASSIRKSIEQGQKLDRYGGFIDRDTGKFRDTGNFLLPKGASYESRALPSSTRETKSYMVYEVIKPFEASVGKATPWFDKVGMGQQIMTDKVQNIDYLMKRGYIKVVE